MRNIFRHGRAIQPSDLDRKILLTHRNSLVRHFFPSLRVWQAKLQRAVPLVVSLKFDIKRSGCNSWPKRQVPARDISEDRVITLRACLISLALDLGGDVC